MKKLLSLLSILTISGSDVSTTIAASSYQKQETKLENNKNIYLQNNNNLEKLNRFKRGWKDIDPVQTSYYHNSTTYALGEHYADRDSGFSDMDAQKSAVSAQSRRGPEDFTESNFEYRYRGKYGNGNNTPYNYTNKHMDRVVFGSKY